MDYDWLGAAWDSRCMCALHRAMHADLRKKKDRQDLGLCDSFSDMERYFETYQG